MSYVGTIYVKCSWGMVLIASFFLIFRTSYTFKLYSHATGITHKFHIFSQYRENNIAQKKCENLKLQKFSKKKHVNWLMESAEST